VSDVSLLFNLLAIDKASEKILGVKGAFGKLAVGVAAGAAVIAEKSIKAAADFESSTNRLITSAGESTANIDMVRKGMLQMAGQVGDSAMDLSQAMYTVESGGRHGAEGLEVLRAAAEGAKAEGADLTTVADALTSVLQDYHLKGSDAAKVTSEMVAAVGSGKTTFEQFAGSLHSVLPIAQSAHVSFVDISAAIASMTVHGMSADQATQNLADTIKHMIAPTGVQTKELAQLGISSSDLADMLGKRGLTGTLQNLSELIINHMGPGGRVLMNAFNQSKDAANDANAMIAKMPAPLQKLAREFQTNKITVADWREALKKLPPEQANLLSQFSALQARASGFNDLLKGGSPAAQTYQDALRRVTGDATGLSTALMLTGENTDYVNSAFNAISSATTEAGNHVKGWADVQSTFNQRMAQFKASLGATSIEIGNVLLPYAKDMLGVIAGSVGWLTKHQTVAGALAATLGALAAVMLTYKTYLFAVNTAQKVATVFTAAWRVAQLGLNGAIVAANIARATAQIIAYVARVAAVELATRAWVVAQFALNAAVVAGNFAAATAQIVAFAAKQAVVALATKAWAAAQWLLNIAMDANPIGLIIAGVALLVGGIILLWTHSKSFRNFFIGMWNDIKIAAVVAGEWVHAKWNTVMNFFSSLPGRISSIASTMWNSIGSAFRGMINWVIDLWNSLHFTIPSVDFLGMHLGGGTIGVPHINHLATGGDITHGGVVMVGERGPEPVYLPTGASVAPHSSLKNAMGGGQVTVVFDVRGADTEFGKLLLSILRTQSGVRATAAKYLQSA